MEIRQLATWCCGVAVAGVMTVAVAAGEQGSQAMTGHEMPMPGGRAMNPPAPESMTTKAQKIANAMTAGPSTVSAKATIMDWPAAEGAAPVVLRPGTNGWSCFPDMPQSKGNDPMCADQAWMKWLEAYLAHKTPEIGHVGVAYMLAPGGGWASNTDPFAMNETADNHWGHHNPHVMIVVPDPKALMGLPTDPNNGGPYVMWAGTPYAHIMAPTSVTRMMPAAK